MKSKIRTPIVIGLTFIILISLIALFAPHIAPYDPNEQKDILETRYLPPSVDHPFGTDKFGRDVLSRVIYGARISLSISLLAVLIAITLGTMYGAVSGYYGSWVDNVMMRFVDLMLAFPTFFLILTLVALFKAKIWIIILVLGLTGWMDVARLVRGEILSLKEKEFVQAARVVGVSNFTIIFRHLLINAIDPVIVAATLRVGILILVESALSFLGLGAQPPTPSWGSIISDGKGDLLTAWWISTFPGLAIVATVISFNLVGDGLRKLINPKL